MAQDPAKEVDLQRLVEGIATAVAKSTAEAVVEAEGKFRVRETGPDRTSVYNPTGARSRPTLTRESFFCGAPQKERFMTDEEILLFNKIKPGRYNNRKWEVIERDGGNGEPPSIHIRIPVREIEDRMQLAMDSGGKLVNILKQIIAEGEAANAKRS